MGITIEDTRVIVRTGDRLIAEKTGFRSGKNGSFDIKLILRKAGLYEMELFMKLQFFFIDGAASDPAWSNDTEHKWTSAEKEKWLKDWHRTVSSYWNCRDIGALKDGKKAGITFRFDIQEAGFMWDHFEIDVTKIPSGGFNTSFVRTALLDADVHLDSEDMTPKASGQLASVHEFGHMIGLPDEYTKGSAHLHDRGSIMNAGTSSRGRHYDQFLTWANTHL